MQVEESGISRNPAGTGKGFCRRILKALLYLHFLLIAVLTLFLFIRGLLSETAGSHRFHPKKWYPPILTSIACSGAVAFAWQWFTYSSPSKAVKAVFWLSPLLTCAVGVLLLCVDNAASMALAAVALVFAFTQSLYACWATPRFEHAVRILVVSTAFPPPETMALVALSMVVTTIYACFLMSGIGGATRTGTNFDIVSILVILLSLTWTMHLIRNTLHVTISRVKYANFAQGVDFDTRTAFLDAVKHSIGCISIASMLVPILGFIRGSARALSLLAGDTDEFMFSCSSCYSGAASRLVMYGNRWAFVQVGVSNKGFVQASADTWEMFRRVGLEPLIDSDLTGSFCFFSGIAVAALSAVLGGSWELAVQKDHATTITIYAFLIGYLMTRIAMAWLQACVSAYHVAFAENRQSPMFNSTIPGRIQELQRSQA